MRPKGPKLASVASLPKTICTLWFQFFGGAFFTTAGVWDCVAAVERLPALHYSVDFIFWPFEIIGFFVEL